MCLAQGHNAVAPVRLEPAVLRSRVKHSTTEPLRSLHNIMVYRDYVLVIELTRPFQSSFMTRKCNLQFIIKVVIWEIEPRYGTEFNEVTLDKANKVVVKTLLPQPLIEKKFLTWNEMCNCNR